MEIVGAEYEASLRLVKHIKEYLSSATYEAIAPRKQQSLPSIYLSFDGKRPLVFDLRKRESTQVFFWLKEHLPIGAREKYDMKPHMHTGWTGMTVKGITEDDFRERLLTIVDYWDACLKAIARGNHQSPYKRQAAIMSWALHAYKDYSVVKDRKSVPHFSGRPDIYVPELEVVIEVDGRQHYEYIKHFHRSPDSFKSQKIRDAKLNEACEESGITLLRIVEDAADSIGSSEALRDLVMQAKGRKGLTYLVRVRNELHLLNKSQFEEHRK